MKKLYFIIVLFLLQVNISIAQKIVPAINPEAGGFSSARLQRLDNTLNEWVEKEWMNGAAAMIIHDGKIVYHKAVGYNDLENKTPLKKDDIFRIASQTKAVTSVAIMLLMELSNIVLWKLWVINGLILLLTLVEVTLG
jgi:CubicO group peptidase (beta-lactamase class C family)